MNITHGLAMPYMGSKRKLAEPIIDHIISHNPDACYFWDLFGGGGAMSFEAVQRHKFKRVVYNELDTGVVNLLKKIMADGVTDEFYQWVDRETFRANKDGDDWISGLCKVIWSFGNIGKTYMFGVDIEHVKRLLHEVVVNKCLVSLAKFNELYGVDIQPFDTPSLYGESFTSETINERRLRVMALVKSCVGRIDLQQLQQLERLERLEQLERLERLQRLEISNLSYADVIIDTPPEQTIIYLDPPYFDTAQYQNKLCHDALHNFIESSPYKIYISGYDMPFKCVREFKHRCTLSGSANNEVTERLFCNREDIKPPTVLESFFK